MVKVREFIFCGERETREEKKSLVVNSLIEEIHLIFGEVSVVKRKYTCATLM